MTEDKKSTTDSKKYSEEEGEAIERGFEQMEMIYRSRCVQMPAGSNVTVKEIPPNERESS